MESLGLGAVVSEFGSFRCLESGPRVFEISILLKPFKAVEEKEKKIMQP